MSDEPGNLVLAYPRRLDARMDRRSQEFREVKSRLSRVDLGLAAARREIAVMSEGQA